MTTAPNQNRVSDAFLAYLEAEEAGEDSRAFLAAYPDIAPDLEKRISALQLLRRVYPGPADGETALNESANLPLRRGERLGDFHVIREIGRGGMGVIYLARQLSIDRPVALKILSPRIAASEISRQRFLNEARAVGRLRHPNIVNVHAAGEWRGLLYIAMEWVPGAGLDTVIAELNKKNVRRPNGRNFYERLEVLLKARGTTLQLPFDDRTNDYPAIMAWLMRDIARALAHAHRQGVLHRDLKPSNVLIDEQGQARLIDFGLNGEIGGPGLTQPSELFGSAAYLAPERLDGNAESEAVDVYGLGVTLYEALTLQPPFKAKSIVDTLIRIKRGKLVRPRRMNSNVPRDLERVVMTAIERNPRRRYASAGELADDLDRFLDGRPVRARRLSRLRALAGWIRRPLLYVVLALSLAMAGLFPWKRAADYAGHQTRVVARRLVDKAVDGITAWFQWALESSLPPSQRRSPRRTRTQP